MPPEYRGPSAMFYARDAFPGGVGKENVGRPAEQDAEPDALA